MSDEPAAAAGQETPAQQTEPPAQQKAPEELPELDPNHTIVIDGEEVTLGNLAQLYAQAKTAPKQDNQLDPNTLEGYQLFEKAMKGDQQALSDIWQRYSPKPAEPAVDPKEQVTQLQQQLQQLQENIQSSKSVTDAISNAAAVNQFQQMVQQRKDKYPHLAKHPQAGQILANKVNAYSQLYATQGNVKNWSEVPVQDRLKLFEACCTSSENEIRSTLQVYGAQPIEPDPKGQQVQAVDDQDTPEQKGLESTQVRANLTVDSEGNLIDRRTGKKILNNQGQPAATIPDQPVQQVPSGHGVGTGDKNPIASGPFSEKTLIEQMRNRMESV